MKKKTVVAIAVIVIIAILAPVGYGLAQRMAVTNLKLHFNRAELANVDFSQTQTINSLQQTYYQLQNPSEGLLSHTLSIESSLPSEQTKKG